MSTPIMICPETREKWHFRHQANMPGWRRQVKSNVIASEAKQSRSHKEDWIASSQELLAMTGGMFNSV
jgi:hypothetical protein